MGGTFNWNRPRLMGVTDFNEFTAEVEARVGAENTELLKDIDLAMNTDERMPYYLDISEDKAKTLALSSGIEAEKFFFYLAVMNEIEYRKTNGPALWERKRSVVPCPDYLSPTEWQMRRSAMPVYNVLSKIWNIALVAVVAGVIPFVIVPVSNFIAIDDGIDLSDTSGLSGFSLVAFFGWIAAALLFAVTFFISRRLRKSR